MTSLKFIQTRKQPSKTTIKNVGKHFIIIDWSNVPIELDGKIHWQRAANKTIDIYRDGVVKTFEIVKTYKATQDAHDMKVSLKDCCTEEEYSIWSRDLKQGDIGKLFPKTKN